MTIDKNALVRSLFIAIFVSIFFIGLQAQSKRKMHTPWNWKNVTRK